MVFDLSGINNTVWASVFLLVNSFYLPRLVKFSLALSLTGVQTYFLFAKHGE